MILNNFLQQMFSGYSLGGDNEYGENSSCEHVALVGWCSSNCEILCSYL